jgi:hypothetical protein
LSADIDPATLSLPAGTKIAAIGTLAAGGPEVRLTSKGKPVPLPEVLGFEHDSNQHPARPVSPVADRH